MLKKLKYKKKLKNTLYKARKANNSKKTKFIINLIISIKLLLNFKKFNLTNYTKTNIFYNKIK